MSVLTLTCAPDNPEARTKPPPGEHVDCSQCGRPFVRAVGSGHTTCQQCQERARTVADLERDVHETVRKMTLAELCRERETWRPGVGVFSDSYLEQVTAQLVASGLVEDDESDIGDRWDGCA